MLFFAGRQVPDDLTRSPSAVSSTASFALGSSAACGGRSPVLWKVLERALRHIKQGDNPAVRADRRYNPFHHHLDLREDL
jgi:hypothetical protein